MAENYTEKPTRIMYKANMSWAPVQTMLGSMVEFGMLDLLDGAGNPVSDRVEPNDRRIPRHDRRSTYQYRVSKKGFVILRIMDLLFEYVESSSDVNVPPAIMRIIARTSGYGSVKGGFDAVINELIQEEMPKLLFDPVPEEEKREAMEDLSAPKPFTVPRSLDARIIDAGIDWLTEMEAEITAPLKQVESDQMPLRARATVDEDVVFVTEKTFDGMFKCPVCRRPAPTEKAIIKHIKKHHGKKALIAVE